MGMMPENMGTKQKVTLGVAVVVLLFGGYMIYTNLFPSAPPPPPPPTPTPDAGGNTPPPDVKPQPANRRKVG